jgi:hypothetical protein
VGLVAEGRVRHRRHRLLSFRLSALRRDPHQEIATNASVTKLAKAVPTTRSNAARVTADPNAQRCRLAVIGPGADLVYDHPPAISAGDYPRQGGFRDHPNPSTAPAPAPTSAISGTRCEIRPPWSMWVRSRSTEARSASKSASTSSSMMP